jgi:hypothetical protein
MRSHKVSAAVFAKGYVDGRTASLAAKMKGLLVAIRHADAAIGRLIARLAHDGYVDIHLLSLAAATQPVRSM